MTPNEQIAKVMGWTYGDLGWRDKDGYLMENNVAIKLLSRMVDDGYKIILRIYEDGCGAETARGYEYPRAVFIKGKNAKLAGIVNLFCKVYGIEEKA
jgi:hypothetical protein